MARTLLFQGDVPTTFWGESVRISINRTPTPILSGKTPYSIKNLLSITISVRLDVYAMQRNIHRAHINSKNDLDIASWNLYLSTYKSATLMDKKDGVCLISETNDFFLCVSRDVVFKENEFPFSSKSTLPSEASLPAEIIPSSFVDDIYMKPPPGYKTKNLNLVYKLNKSIYGLKQSCWFEKLSKSLLQYGFVQSKNNYSLFACVCGSNSLYIIIYVDDLR